MNPKLGRIDKDRDSAVVVSVSETVVREIALEAGFDLVRFGPTELGQDGERFTRWLDAGRAGEMDYLHRNAERIRDPEKFAPGARTTIALGFDYSAREPVRVPVSAEGTGTGKVARYARGRDYHRSLGNATRKIRAELERAGVPHGSTRVATDAAPVLERALATRAGIGFLAKSSGVLSPTLGPYLLLSEVLTPLELPFDLPSPGTCGTCTKCIDACPTDAIVAPYEVDARRCLSYTTIELRGSIPRDLREPQGDWLFGCDVCLEVCPFTSKSSNRTDHPDLTTHRALETWSLVGILELDEQSWDEDWTGTAIRRATRSGLRRNAAVVLGNLGDAAAQPALERALADQDAVVREHAAWALGKVAPRSNALESRLRDETVDAVCEEIRRALEVR